MFSGGRNGAGGATSDAVGVLGDESFDHVDDFLLLALGQSGNRLKRRTRPTAGRIRGRPPDDAPKQTINIYAQYPGHGGKEIGARRLAATLPIADVRMMDAQLSGQVSL